jgi:acetylcholinesterase
MQFPFLPVVDNYFLEEEPIIALNRGNFKKCPILLGVNKDESNYFYIYAFTEYRNLSIKPDLTYDQFKIMLSSLFYYYPQFPTTITKPVLDAIIFKYTNWDNVHNMKHNIEKLDDAASDYHFICPALDMASIFALNKLDVYFYHFTQRASTHLWPEWLI